MRKRWLSALVMAGALTLSACAGGATTTESSGGGGEVATDAEGPKSLLIWVDAVREPACLSYQESVAGEIEVTCEVVGQEEILSKIQLARQTGEGAPDVTFD